MMWLAVATLLPSSEWDDRSKIYLMSHFLSRGTTLFSLTMCGSWGVFSPLTFQKVTNMRKWRMCKIQFFSDFYSIFPLATKTFFPKVRWDWRSQLIRKSVADISGSARSRKEEEKLPVSGNEQVSQINLTWRQNASFEPCVLLTVPDEELSCIVFWISGFSAVGE